MNLVWSDLDQVRCFLGRHRDEMADAVIEASDRPPYGYAKLVTTLPVISSS
jgi:hypothetical protein